MTSPKPVAGTRAPFQVLVLPFRRSGPAVKYALFRRTDAGYWQGIAGGGESGETPPMAARRETFEESGILPTAALYELSMRSHVPVTEFEARAYWPRDLYVIPEYAFAVEAETSSLILSDEHMSAEWLSEEEAIARLHWQTNKVALWELAQRIRDDTLIPAE
jgi:dATP pyrophosphohydrolase